MKIKVILLLFLLLLITGCKNNESINLISSKKEVDWVISTTTKVSTTKSAVVKKAKTTKKKKIIKNKKKLVKITSISTSSTMARIDKSPKIDNEDINTSTTMTKIDRSFKKEYLEEERAYHVMMNLQAKYPTGTIWDNNVPYSCEENPYKLKGLVDGKRINGCGCAAFVFMLSNSYFNDAPGKRVYSLDNIKVGDIIRYMHDKHSIIILKIVGDTYTIAEANIITKEDKKGRVMWNQHITKNEILNNGFNYVITRW